MAGRNPKLVYVPVQALKEGSRSRSPISVNDHFGRWVVEEDLGYDPVRGRHSYRCRCDCGTVRPVSASNLRSRKTNSCGCRRQEGDTLPCGKTKHGLCYSPEYLVWTGMKRRCYDPKAKGYDRYGGRGIRVCERWLHAFEHFYADMGARPSARHRLEREDNNGPYAPGNCRWATPKEQASNRRNTHFVTWKGETLCLAEWSRRTGICTAVLLRRLRKGWPVEKVFTAPRRSHQIHFLTFTGKTMKLTEWAEELGIPSWLILHRLQAGWPLEDALSATRHNKWTRPKRD